MKTLKSIMAGIAFLCICMAVNASAKPPIDAKLNTVNTYINAISQGKINNLQRVLNDDMEYDMKRGENVTTLNKKQLLDYLKNNTSTDPSVTTNTTVITDDDDTYVVKVEFKYADITRTDIVRLSNSSGWQITKVVSSFK